MAQELPFKTLLMLSHHPPAWRVGGCGGHQRQEQPEAAVPFLPIYCMRFSKALRFCFAAWVMLPSPDKVPGMVWGMHREGLAIFGLFMKAHFLGGASYQFCGHFPQRCTKKKKENF